MRAEEVERRARVLRGLLAAASLGIACVRPFGADAEGGGTPVASEAPLDAGSDAAEAGDAGATAGELFHVRIGTRRWTWTLQPSGLGAAETEGEPPAVVRPLAPPPASPAGLRCGRVERTSSWLWFCMRSADGVLTGRAGETKPGAARPVWTSGHPTAFAGWSARLLDAEGPTRVFETDLGDGRRARLRVGASTGRLKVWSSAQALAQGEEFERDLSVLENDGRRLVMRPACTAVPSAFRLEAEIDERTLRGRLIRDDGSVAVITGERAEVLTAGLEPRDPLARARWQERTRTRLRLLALGGDPAPSSVEVDVLQDDLPPLPHVTYSRARDDDPDSWAPLYRRRELRFRWEVVEPWSGAVLVREAHAWLMTPGGAPPSPAGRPALLSLNGHTGSARRTTDPDDLKYWFGEAFARRGYVVLALDLGHRDLAGRRGLYGGYVSGDDPAGGNGLHPTLAVPGEPSAWEEMGERAWDAERAAEYLRALPGVDPARTFVMGHSMGGEVALWAAALDPDLGAVVSSGFAGDYGVMSVNGAHPCFLWANADAREYIDTSDLAALVAPRPLVVMQGALDPLYSALKPLHGQAREFFRRAARAWGVDPLGDALSGQVGAPLWFYLHHDEHFVLTADRSPTDPTRPIGLTFPARPRPRHACDTSWQTEEGTARDPRTLFDLVGAALQ